MGTYIYGLSKQTKTDPVYGKVHILKFLHKPLYSEWTLGTKAFLEQERREQGYHDRWKGQELPKYVCWEKTKRGADGRLTDIMEYRGGAVWCDEYEECVTYVRYDGRDVTPLPDHGATTTKVGA